MAKWIIQTNHGNGIARGLGGRRASPPPPPENKKNKKKKVKIEKKRRKRKKDKKKKEKERHKESDAVRMGFLHAVRKFIFLPFNKKKLVNGDTSRLHQLL